MKLEYVWFLLPIFTVLWQAGGTWNKLFRRVGIPASVLIVTFLLLGFSLWLPLATLPYFLITTMPFTLIGNSIHDHWFNWVWIWISSLLQGLASLGFGILFGLVGESLLLSLVMLIWGLCATLSNVKGTAKYFPWKLCEGVNGFFLAIPIATLLQLGG